MKQRISGIFLILAILLVSTACMHTPTQQAQPDTFHTFTLSNGIPVFVNITTHSRTKALVCTMQGGKKLVPPDKAGLDRIAFKLMSMESNNYSDLQRRSLLKKTSAEINASDGLDFSLYYLKTIDTYFDEIFDLYADLFQKPAFPEKLFAEVVTNMKNNYRSDLTDGYARASKAVNTTFFKGHPYASHLYTLDTLDAITLDDVKTFYKKNKTASRMAFFAAGNFNIKRLRKKLDSAFGSIEGRSSASSMTPPLQLKEIPPLILDPYTELNRNVAYVRGNFPTVPYTHPDYWALKLGANITSDIMNDLIRTKNSLVYSVWTHLYGNQANYANISAYRTSDPVKVMELVQESIEIVSSGKCLSPYQRDGQSGDYVPVAEGLDFYKRSFSTKFYSGLQETGSIARKMAGSYMLTGDPAAYLQVINRINAVQPEDVARVSRAYIKASHKCWAVSAHPEMIEKVQNRHAAFAPTYTTIDLQ